ncbi:hypothetical protein [Flavobacterium hibernum]|nr:hypothetical protein [Flavobacterium hibernum]STO14380.1 Uncharacterised protein [Flavobacterium hibernum]
MNILIKKYSFLLLLFNINMAFSQTKPNSNWTLAFNVNFPPSSESIEDINFANEKPECKFELKGKVMLKYSFCLQNDSIASLFQFKNNKYEFQENMIYQPYLWHFDGELLISNFKIIDFNHDGNEDLLCWINSNINGNRWTILFMNDQRQQKLVRLYNTADQTDIWDYPQYHNETKIISTEFYGSAFGTSGESSYKLKDDFTIIPLQKHFQDRTTNNIVDYNYVGKNGKWKLKSKVKIKP